jgi:hypothetical protein
MIETKIKKKTKRNWKTENLPKVFTVRADEAEHQAIKKLSKKYGLSMSRLMIEATLNKSIQTTESVRAEMEILKNGIFQLHKVGINLNQIAQSINAIRRGNKATKTEIKIESVVDEVKEAIREVKKQLKRGKYGSR